MIVLSLFDGMSCLQIALKELGIIPKVYYASEIDKHAIKQTQLNFPETIQLGDITKWQTWDIDWKSIDFIWAGSPCQGFSFAGKQLAFDDPRSKLFFEFVNILNHVKKLNPDVKFLLENVNMKKEHMRVINEFLGIAPVRINSNLVSAQNRDRWYWSNIKTEQSGLFGYVYTDIPQPKDRGIYLKDILEDEVDEKYYISQTVLNRIERKTYSNPKFNPEKTGALNTKNNSGQMSIDSGTTFISIDGKVPTQRNSTGRCMDAKHNYQIINLDGKLNPNQEKARCFTAGAHSGGNHSDMDLICVTMVGRKIDENGTRKDNSDIKAVQRLEANTTGKTNCLTSVQKDNLVCLTPRRTEFGKHVRKEYEAGNIYLQRNEITKLEPRNDGKTNTLTSVQKDNLICIGGIINGEFKKGTSKEFSQGNRVCDENSKSTCQSSEGGGMGAKTGLYAISQRSRGKNKGSEHIDKTPTLSSNSWEQNNLLT